MLERGHGAPSTVMRARALTTAAWVSVSVLVGHLAAYRLTYDDPHARAHALAASGHGWTGYLPMLLAAAVLGAILGTVSTAIRERAGRERSRVRELLVLGVGGTLAYSLVEIGERLMHHGSVDGVLHDLSGGGYTTLLVGVLFVLATAPLLLLARRSIEALVAASVHTPHGVSLVKPLVDAARVRELLLGIEPNRGPPLTRLG